MQSAFHSLEHLYMLPIGGTVMASQAGMFHARGHGVNGDEYNSLFFDRGPKFLHDRQQIFLQGPAGFDHGDLYRDHDAVLTAFCAGTAQVPRDGAVVVSVGNEAAVSATRDTTTALLDADVVIGCSSGSFDGFHRRFPSALGEEETP